MDAYRGEGSAATDAWRRSNAVRFEYERPMPGTTHNTADPRHSGSSIRVLVRSGRSCVLHGMGMPTVIIPLRGSVKLIESESTRILRKGQLFLCEGANHVQAIGRGDSLWVTLIAPVSVWRRFVDVISEQTIPAPVLLPATHVADRTVRRAVVRLAREAQNDIASGESESAMLRFVSLLLDLQSTFDPFIGRCPGRTLGQRRGVFLRLQRVRNYMESSSDLDLGIAELARVANYSPCHFLRTFNSVYGKTPHAVLVEQRLKRARRLVNDTALSIAEVARASGFENRCAFARSFKRRFGETATALRERGLVGASVCE
jgi:AraC family transcriptional regulator